MIIYEEISTPSGLEIFLATLFDREKRSLQIYQTPQKGLTLNFILLK